jgi:triacylglycerol esterase/lipase EstA (alpha/beta hydrolase family)
MKILWFTWKDRANPLAGGAEFINEEIAARLAEDGHQIILLVGGFRVARERRWSMGTRSSVWETAGPFTGMHTGITAVT